MRSTAGEHSAHSVCAIDRRATATNPPSLTSTKPKAGVTSPPPEKRSASWVWATTLLSVDPLSDPPPHRSAVWPGARQRRSNSAIVHKSLSRFPCLGWRTPNYSLYPSAAGRKTYTHQVHQVHICRHALLRACAPPPPPLSRTHLVLVLGPRHLGLRLALMRGDRRAAVGGAHDDAVAAGGKPNAAQSVRVGPRDERTRPVLWSMVVVGVVVAAVVGQHLAARGDGDQMNSIIFFF